ncbi:UPF0312 protein plu2095 [Arthrobacter sp. Hiyo6]|nr:UPF0312 protein plu2095 [Arthrobacter sp. Hiyo6]
MPELSPDLSGEWRFDPNHTRIGFSTRHAMVTKVRGAFNDVEGIINADAENPANSSVSVTIKVASIDTRNTQRDEHLRTNDFFDAPSFPEITFVSTRVDQIEEGNFIVAGNLTIRGITKEVSLPIEFLGVERDQTGQLRAGFEAPAGSTVSNSASSGTPRLIPAACSSLTKSLSSLRFRPSRSRRARPPRAPGQRHGVPPCKPSSMH